MWDSFTNRYNLISTTGIKGISSKSDYQKVSYQSGEGFTGHVVTEKQSIIIDDISVEKDNGGHIGKYPEDVKHQQEQRKTMMLVPIFRPSKRDEIVGILRFVNKKNSANTNVIDYFNDSDEEIISYASKYLALTIDYFLGEEERNDFISKLSHEFSSPANLIYVSAGRLLKYKDDPHFFKRYVTPYLENIRDFSKLQLQQADTNLHVSKIRQNTSRAQKYDPKFHLLTDIITQGKTAVIPHARIEDIRFDNIEIDKNFPNWMLYIDKGAFVTIFYNLLTNAIKYRNPNRNFSVKITGKEFNNWLIINISDYGLGIEMNDIEKIFLMGYRANNVTIYNSDGFGIGLPVVKQIVEDFGGMIYVSSPMTPTIFEIKLPEKLFNSQYTKEIIWNSEK